MSFNSSWSWSSISNSSWGRSPPRPLPLQKNYRLEWSTRKDTSLLCLQSFHLDNDMYRQREIISRTRKDESKFINMNSSVTYISLLDLSRCNSSGDAALELRILLVLMPFLYCRSQRLSQSLSSSSSLSQSRSHSRLKRSK